MKFTALLLASAVTAATAADAPKCDTVKLVSLVAGPDGSACTKASGYNIAAGVPTEDQLVKVCGNSNCQALLQALAAYEECVLDTARKKLHAELLDPILAACAKLATTPVVTTTPTPTTNATTTKVTTTDPTTTKPSTTTTPTTTEVTETIETPKETSTSTGSGSVAETEEVKTPKPTDKTDSAATMAVATCALLAAAAATLF